MLESKLRKLKLHENGNCFKLNYKDKMLTFSLGSKRLQERFQKNSENKELNRLWRNSLNTENFLVLEREREREKRDTDAL